MNPQFNMDIRSRIQNAGETIEEFCHPLFRIMGLYTTMHAVLENLGKAVQRVQNQEPRAVLLAGVAVLVALPMLVLWICLLFSFQKRPGVWKWMLGGVVLGGGSAVLGFGGLDKGRVLEMDAIFAHLGAAIGWGVKSCTSLARGLDPSLLSSSNDTVSVKERHGQILGEKSDSESERGEEDFLGKITMTTKESPIPERTIMYLLTMTWFATGLCGNIAEDSLSETTGFPGYLKMCSRTAVHVVAQMFYVFVAVRFFKNTRDVRWECIVGVVVGGVSFALLRLTAGDSTWRSWLLDGGLAFVGLNLGMLGGLYLRYRSLLSSK